MITPTITPEQEAAYERIVEADEDLVRARTAMRDAMKHLDHSGSRMLHVNCAELIDHLNELRESMAEVIGPR